MLGALSGSSVDGLGGLLGGPSAFDTTGDPIILGALDISLMRPVVAGLAPAFESCSATHAGSGRVLVKFVVAKDGTVSTSTVKSSTTANAELDTCIAEAFGPALFPEPKGGGIVIASWPVDIQPG